MSLHHPRRAISSRIRSTARQQRPMVISKIITNAHLIRRGQMPELRTAGSGFDFYFARLGDSRGPDQTDREPNAKATPARPDPRCSSFVHEPWINRSARIDYGAPGCAQPARSGESAAERSGWRFQVWDKVIQTENAACSAGAGGPFKGPNESKDRARKPRFQNRNLGLRICGYESATD
jgi:hypothetical protein